VIHEAFFLETSITSKDVIPLFIAS